MGKLKDSNENVILNLDKYIFSKANANYGGADFLYCYIDFEKEIDNIIISLIGKAGTPRDQISHCYVEFPYQGNPNRACVFVKGAGFVQGHIIQIGYIAKLKD